MEIRQIGRLKFTGGSNESGFFWEHQAQDGTCFIAQKGHGCWWWCLYQMKHGHIKTLNCCLIDHDGERHEDALYQSESRDAPLGIDYWLNALTQFIEQHLVERQKTSDRPSQVFTDSPDSIGI